MTLCLTSLVLLAAYSAFLISSLAVQHRNLPFRDLQGLLHDGSYRLGIEKDNYIHNMFSRATGRIESDVYKKLIAPYTKDLPATRLDGLRRVCADKNYAYIGINPLNTEFARTLPCQLVPLPGTSYREKWAFIISKNSPYKGLINWRLAQIRERGIQARIRQQYVLSKEHKEQPSATDVSLLTVAPILVVLATGYVIGIFILLIERCVHGNILKWWSRGSVGSWRQIEY